MANMRWMARTAHLAGVAAFSAAVLLAGALQGQSAPPVVPQEVEKVTLLLDEALRDALQSGQTDPFLRAVLKNREVAVPILAGWLRMGAPTHTLAQEEEVLVGDALSYIATPEAIREIGSLAEDKEAIAPLIQRCLDYAIGRGNPFQLAYVAVESGNRAKEQVKTWLLDVTAKGRGYELWALAVSDRMAASRETLWRPEADSLVQLLPGGEPPELATALEQKGVHRSGAPPV